MATTYFGADVSVNQGIINWTLFAPSVDFVFIQAAAVTFGGGGLVTDGNFATNQSQARSHSVKRGFYFFVRDSDVVGRSGVTDASYFIGVVGSLQTGESMVLDVDMFGGYNSSVDTYASDFCNTILSFYGSNLPTCLLYSSLSELSGSLSWPTASGVTYCWPAAYDGFGGTNWGAYTIPAWSGKVYPGSASAPSDYYFHQYSSSGTFPGISGNVDQDSFYSLNNTLADWDRFGFSGAVIPGTLTNATITNPTMTYNQPAQQTIIVPTNKYDQVLYSNVWTTSITSSTWPQTITAPSTNINQYAYTVGNFTVSGNTYDFGVVDFGSSGYGQFPGNLPTVFVQPVIDSAGGLTFIVTYTPGGSATLNLVISYALLAYPGASIAPIQQARVNQAFANVFPPANPTLYSTYRRIAADSSVGTGTFTLVHNQATVPNLFYWVQDNTGTFEMQPVTWTNAGLLSGHFGLSMDSTNVYFYVDSVNNTECWYRIYKDN